MFENVLFQSASDLLSHDISTGSLPGSVLFAGPYASGKLSCALELARVLSCLKKGDWQCDCPNCLQHKALVSPNALLVGPGNRTLEIRAAKDTLLHQNVINSSHLDSARYLYLRAVRKLTVRFSPVLWEGDDKLTKFSPVLQAINEELEKINPGRIIPEPDELQKILDAVEKQCEKLENTFLYDSLPVQQIARVLVQDEKIGDKDLELIDAVIDRTYIHELYAPDFADNIKELVRAGNPQVIENNKGKYLGLWFRLLLRYPGDYVKAWFDLVGGYIYPDIPYKVGDVDGIMGNDLGLYWKPLIGGNAVVKTKEILIKMSDFVPLYGMLWCIGAYSWLLIIGFVMGLYRKREILGIVLLMLLIGTLLIASPVVDFRYAYGMIFSSPLWISSIFSDDKKRLD